MTEEMITISKKDYDELVATNELLCRILGDHDLIGDYRDLYPELVAAAGFTQEDEDEEPVMAQDQEGITEPE